MRRVYEKKGSTIVLMEYIHEPPDPLPRPMTGSYLREAGFSITAPNTYEKEDVTIHYDGCYWWVYYWCAMFRIETIEEFEKLVQI